MDKRQLLVWNDELDELTFAVTSPDENEKKRIKKRKSEIAESKIYCPHKRLIFKFKESLNFTEQTRFRKNYSRKTPTHPSLVDVVLLQDVKDLTLYLITSPLSFQFIKFIHLAIVDRFLRALLLYMQHFLTTYAELSEKRAATKKRAANPLAGGARVQRAAELKALRLVLAREYCDLLCGFQKGFKNYHHADAGQSSFVQSNSEMDFRLYEGLIQFAHRVVWIALERKYKELIEIEIHRLFRSDSFNNAKMSKYAEICHEWEVPEDEHWILYGPELPPRRKILRTSALPYEILNTDCDYRVLTLGLSNAKFKDPRVAYLENALLAKEQDLPKLGIKLGILGLHRHDFDAMLIPQASEDDQMIIADEVAEQEEDADDYETLMPVCSSNPELNIPFPMDKDVKPRFASSEKIRHESKMKWLQREAARIASNYADTVSVIAAMN